MKRRVLGSKTHNNKARNPTGRTGTPVSLYPLSFAEAVSGLAQVKMPAPDKTKPKATPAKGK